MAPYATPLSPRWLRVVVGVALGGALAGCSIWPQSWSLRSDPLPEEQVQETAAQPAAAASAPAACADCATATTAPQASAVATPVVPAAPLAPTVEAAQPAPQVTKLEVAQAAAPIPTATAASAHHTLTHGFYVNVGVFAVAHNASAVRAKLDGTGLPIVVDTVKAKDAQATRIRVGPFAKRTQAQAAAKKIHALKLDAVVVRL